MTEIAKTLRLGSWNIRAGLGTDLRRDPLRTLDTIATMGAQAVALQEADFRLGARPSALPVAAIRARTGLAPVTLGGEGIGWHGNALLVAPDLDVEEAHVLDLPGLEPRGAISVDLGGPFALRIVAVHLGLLRSSRKAQLAAIRAFLDRLAPRPTVIIGDFNEWSRRRGMDPLGPAFHLVTPGRTFPSRRPLVALDRIACTRELTVTPRPIRRDRGTQPSDHLPILADLSLKAPQAK